MSLLDADTQPLLTVMTQKTPYQTDSMGIALHNLTGVRNINGRLSRPTFTQQSMWGTLGVAGEYTLYTYDGNIDNGMFILNPSDKRLFRVTGPRNKSYTDGSLSTFWAYRTEEVTSQVLWDTSVDQQPALPPRPTNSAPAQPTGLFASGSAPAISLAWNATYNSVFYRVYRGTSSGGETLLQSGVKTNSYTDTTALANVTYYYYVTAVNGFAASGQSNEVNNSLLNSLLAYWTLNESSGNRADSTGNGNTMVQTGSITGAAGFGNVGNVSVWPNNSADYLDTGTTIFGASAFTVAGWFNATAVTAQQCLFSQGSMHFDIKSSGFSVSINGTNTDTFGAATLSASTWYHFTLTHSGVAGNIWVNGVSLYSLGRTPTINGGCGLGIRDAFLDLPFGGSLVGWGVWGRVLSATGIANLYNASNGQAYSSFGSLAG